MQPVCGWDGSRGVLSRVGDHILQEVYSLYVTRFLTYKIAYPILIPPPQDKNLEREGPQPDKQLPQSPFAGRRRRRRRKKKKKFCIAFYESYLSTVTCIRKAGSFFYFYVYI
jgi:hypothetical protein